jgi:hypothetical protein
MRRATAAVLTAALDGVLLHRPLGPDLTASSVRQVLGRLLVRAEAQPVLGVQSPKGKKGADKR